jgi:hypothetical protein
MFERLDSDAAMTKRALLLFAILAVGCVEQDMVEIKPEAAAIKTVKEDDKPFRCEVLGDVHGTSRSADKDKARRGAENAIKNDAAMYKGANYVLLEIDRNKQIGISSVNEAFLGGKALKCKDSG